MTEDWRFRRDARTDRNGELSFQPSEVDEPSLFKRITESSRVCRLIGQAEWTLKRARPPAPSASLQESFDAIVHDPYSPADQEVWRYSLGFVGRMAELLRASRTAFLVVIIPIGTQVEPVPREYAARMRWQYMAGGRRLEYTGYQRQVAGYCRDNGIACLDLLAPFRAANPTGRRSLYLERDGHWTAAGHALAAQCIAASLRKPKES
jgi:hypothetical protein